MFTMIKLTFKLVKLMTIFAVIAIIAFLAACQPFGDCKVFILEKDTYSLSQDDSVNVYLGCPLNHFEYDFVAIYQDLDKGPMMLQTIQDKENDRLIAKLSSQDLKNFGFLPGEAGIFVYRRMFNPSTRDYSPELSYSFRVELKN